MDALQISLCRDLYGGYISREKNILTEEASYILKKCIKQTSKKLNISEKKVEKNIFTLSSISMVSLKIPSNTDIN